MNQSQKIREIILKLFKSNKDKSLKQVFEVDGVEREGIKYIDLKKFLLSYEEYNFSEGAVVGALQTLTGRLENIYKVKTRNGVFFFYSEKEDIFDEHDNSEATIIESEDFKRFEDKVEVVNVAIVDILRNVSKGKYLEVKDIDLNYLRDLLKFSGELQSVLSSYKTEKMFEEIEEIEESKSQSFDDSPSFDDLPF